MSIKKTKPQKSRDAKSNVLTSRARNKQLALIKKSSKKSMRQYSKEMIRQQTDPRHNQWGVGGEPLDKRYWDSHYA